MDAQFTLGETTSGTGATGPGGRSVSLPLRQVTGTVGLVAGECGPHTAAVVVDALADRGWPVLVLDCDGSFTELSTPFDARSCHAGSDADHQLDVSAPDDVVGMAHRTDRPVVVDGRQTAGATLAALTRAMLQHSDTADRPAVCVVCGLAAVFPDDEPLDELGRAIRRLITQGPDRDLGICGVTDQPADVHPTMREARSWSVWHRLTRTADTSLVRRELGGERAQAVRDLPVSQAFLRTDWTASVERLSVRPDESDRPRSTDDGSGLTAADGERSLGNSPERDPPDLEAFATRLEELVTTVENRLDPDRLATDLADALEPRLDSARLDSGRTDGSRSVTHSNDANGSTDDDGFAGFELLEDDGADEADSGAHSPATDGLAGLAGVGDDGSETPSAKRNGAGDHAVSDGGLDIEGVSAEVATFEAGAAAVETEVEAARGKPAVVVDVESTLEDLDDAAISMLEHYRTEGPARPEAAHSAATESASRVPAYTLNRQLRRAGLIEHVGRGRYDYSLYGRIEAGLPADRDDEMAAVYVRDLEAAIRD